MDGDRNRSHIDVENDREVRGTSSAPIAVHRWAHPFIGVARRKGSVTNVVAKHRFRQKSRDSQRARATIEQDFEEIRERAARVAPPEWRGSCYRQTQRLLRRR